VASEKLDCCPTFAYNRQARDLRMFGSKVSPVPGLVGLRPTTVELGRVTQRSDHLNQAIVAATLYKCRMKRGVGGDPFLGEATLTLARNHRSAVEDVLGSQHLPFPSQVAPLDGPPESYRLDCHARLGQLQVILWREVHHKETVLRDRSNEALAGKAAKCLASDVESDIVLRPDLVNLEPLSGAEPARKDVASNSAIQVLRQGLHRDAFPRRIVVDHIATLTKA